MSPEHELIVMLSSPIRKEADGLEWARCQDPGLTEGGWTGEAGN